VMAARRRRTARRQQRGGSSAVAAARWQQRDGCFSAKARHRRQLGGGSMDERIRC
jgi:hypothetical protein